MSEPREEVQNVLSFLGDSLTAARLIHVVEQDDLNPNAFMVAAHDEEGYVNSGLVGWNEEKQQVNYFCLDTMRASHDDAEGVPEEDSRPWWNARSAAVFLMFLEGEVRKIQAHYRRLVREAEEKELDSES